MILKAGDITRAVQKAKQIMEDERDYRTGLIKYDSGKTKRGAYPRERARQYHSRRRETVTYTLRLSRLPTTQREIGLPCARCKCKRLIDKDAYCISKRTAKNSVRDYFHIDCAVMLHIWPVDEEAIAVVDQIDEPQQ